MPASQSFVNPPDPAAGAWLVADTNVVLDWLVFREPGVAALAAALERGRIGLLACAATRDELRHMLGHPGLARWQPDPPALLARFDAAARLLGAPPAQHLLRPADADDQVFVDLALSTAAPWLLTRDRALLRLAKRARARGLGIGTPEARARDGGPPRA